MSVQLIQWRQILLALLPIQMIYDLIGPCLGHRSHWENSYSLHKPFISSGSKSCEKYILFSFWFQNSNQVTVLYMPWQLSCHGMCKIVTWLDNYFAITATYIFTRFWLWAHELYVKWVIGSMTDERWHIHYPKQPDRVSWFVFFLKLI